LKLQIGLTDRGVTVTAPEWPGLTLGPLTPALTLDGEALSPEGCEATREGEGARLRHTFSRPGVGIVQTWTHQEDGWRVRSELINRADGPVCLNAFTLLEGEARFGEAPEQCRAYEERSGYYAYVRGLMEPMRQQAMKGEATDVAPATAERPHVSSSQGVSVVYNPAEGAALAVGGVTFRRWIPAVRMETGDGRVLGWRVACDGGDTLLDPGAHPLEEVLFLAGRDPWDLLEGYGDAVQRELGIVPLTESPVTWCSWYPFRLTVSEEKMLANARVAAERLKPLGLSVMEIDLGWQDRYLPNVVEVNGQFPNGLKWLSERMEALGLRLGLWTAPYSVSAFSEVAQEHPEWLISGENGEPLQRGTWYWEPHGGVYVLDLTHPGAQAWLRSCVERLAGYGATYLKTDFIGNVHGSECRRRHDPRVVAGGGLEAGRIGARIISEGMPEGSLLLNCNGVDYAGLGRYPLLYCCWDTGNTGYVGWRHLRETYNTVACHLYKHRRWGVLQPSCLCVGLPGTLDEARARATATFLCGGEVNVSDDLTTLPEERWRVLEATLPPLGAAARPVDLFESEFATVWHLKVRGEWEAWDLMGLFNFNLPPPGYDYGDKTIGRFEVSLDRLGLDPDGVYWGYEFWGGQFLGEVRKALRASFFGPGVALIALRPARPHPWVVGTGFHQSNGVELAGVRWEASTQTLSGEARRPAGTSGHVAVACPEGYSPVTCEVDGAQARMRLGLAGDNLPSSAGGDRERQGLRGIHIPITMRREVAGFRVRFERDA
jgi:hypothetical protein